MAIPLQNLSLWAWRLLPGNPILVRVVAGKSRRLRHLWLRFGYLAALLFVVMIAMMTSGDSSTASSLASLSRRASMTFMWASIAQLAMMCVLAPVFAADAITQERDSQTFNILLATPLSNAQIVLGSLFSRLFFVVTLLLSGLPIFLLMMVYGGVTTSQILVSFMIAGATALLTGSLAITISMVRVGTRRTIFSFYLLIGIYLAAGWACAQFGGLVIDEAPANQAQEKLTWAAALNPFLSLDVALNRIEAPDPALVAHYGWPLKQFAAYPPVTYMTLCFVASFLLISFSLFFVRRGAKEGEVTFWTKVAFWNRMQKEERHRKARTVWSNPVAWREAATRASAVTRGLMTYLLIGGGITAALILLYSYGKGTISAQETREWLAILIMAEFAAILIVAVNTAATSMTKEREANTIDLLLTTPLTSKYIVWGKLRGLVSFSIPLLCIPLASLIIFGLYDLMKKQGTPVVPVESSVEIGAVMIMYIAVACMIGMDRSLKSKKTVQAVMMSVGLLTILLLVATLMWRAIVMGAGDFGGFLAPLTPFTAIETIINPSILFEGDTKKADSHLMQLRFMYIIGAGISTAVVAAIVGGMYKSIVRNFDMTMRKQSAR